MLNVRAVSTKWRVLGWGWTRQSPGIKSSAY